MYEGADKYEVRGRTTHVIAYVKMQSMAYLMGDASGMSFGSVMCFQIRQVSEAG